MTDLTQALGFQFNANEVEIKNFEPVPAGEYLVSITGVELKDSQKKGKMLVFDFTVQTGANDGRVVVDRLNIVNASKDAERIALETLAKICKAVNIETPKNTNEFIGKRLKIKVDIEPGVGTYIDNFGQEKPCTAKNKIKGYYSFNGGAAPVEQKQESGESAPW